MLVFRYFLYSIAHNCAENMLYVIVSVGKMKYGGKINEVVVLHNVL